ncbi:MAG: TonB-dependent siderophore receptor, partial [Pseudomonadota bacterium]
GDGIADIPFDRVMNNPTDKIDQETLIAGYDFEHRLNESWKLRNQFSYVYGSYDYGVFVAPLALDDSTGTLTRLFSAQDQDSHTFTTDTNVQGKFRTGPFEHTGLIGFDLTQRTENFLARIDFSPAFFSNINIFDPDYFAVPIPDESDIAVGSETKINSRQIGLYMQDQVEILDNLILVGGFRADDFSSRTKDKLTDSISQKDNQRAFSPRAGAVYRPIEPISLYANYSESFRPTGTLDASGNALPPEEGQGFEVGVKVDFIPDRLSSTLAFFDITKQNVATADPVNPFASVATGEQRSRGVDVDLTGEILPGWNVIASYAYIDAEVTKDNDASLVGNEFPGIPRHSGNLWTTYEFLGGPFKGVGAGIGFNYVGERKGDLANSFEVDSYVVTNAGVYYRWRNWLARLNVDNIFNVDYIESASGSRTFENIPGAPFTIRGSISATF